VSAEQDVPYRFAETTPLAEVATRFSAIESGGSSGVVVTVGGRIMRNRPQGGLAFAELRDWSGALQLFALASETEDFEAFTRLSLGDWIGATGEVVRTRRGELSVKVASWSLLARARVGFGDKWHGVADPDLRYRQREVDLWANEGVREVFLTRSKVLRAIRAMLDASGFVEVETPVLQPVASGGHARPFVTYYNVLHAEYYLRIATELYLKRLVVGGFERVFEVGRLFRNEGLSPRHNPEFTVLEAYQVYADYLDMAELIESLVAGAANAVLGRTTLEYQGRPLELAPPWRRASMNEVIAEATGTEFELEMGLSELARRARALGVEPEASWGPGKLIGEVYERLAEPVIWAPTHVLDYPLEVSPLARAHRSRPGYAERLSPVIAGREIAEAYSELTDPDEQRARFSAQAAERAAGNEEAMATDEEFLEALEHGMPPTGGIGIGIDRVVMVLTDQANIKEVLLFPALRPRAREEEPSP